MAKNRVYARAEMLSLTPTQPTAGTVNSGDPVLVGNIPGVALTASRSDNSVSVALAGVFQLSVKGYNGSANTAINAGDKLYYKVGASPVLDVDSSGVFYGFALAAVTSGATSTIDVLVGTPG